MVLNWIYFLCISVSNYFIHQNYSEHCFAFEMCFILNYISSCAWVFSTGRTIQYQCINFVALQLRLNWMKCVSLLTHVSAWLAAWNSVQFDAVHWQDYEISLLRNSMLLKDRINENSINLPLTSSIVPQTFQSQINLDLSEFRTKKEHSWINKDSSFEFGYKENLECAECCWKFKLQIDHISNVMHSLFINYVPVNWLISE